MKTFIREFETTEAMVTIFQTGTVSKAKIQRYGENNILPCISKSFSENIELDEYDSPRTISDKIEKRFNLTNCYDLNDWRVL